MTRWVGALAVKASWTQAPACVSPVLEGVDRWIQEVWG